jgi:hypothetical protein
MCRLSTNLGASTSWNPKGLSRPVMGLLYLLQQEKTRDISSEKPMNMKYKFKEVVKLIFAINV